VKPTAARVMAFQSADDFLKTFKPTGPSCLVLDVRMPGMSGLELQTRLAQSGVGIPIIIVTGHADIKMAVDSVKSGALNFLEKPFRPQELFDEVQRAIRIDQNAWRRREEEKSVAAKLAMLKPGERAVLDLIINGKGNTEIAQQLQMSIRGVEARRAKAMKKLGVSTKQELVQLLRPSNADVAAADACELRPQDDADSSPIGTA